MQLSPWRLKGVRKVYDPAYLHAYGYALFKALTISGNTFPHAVKTSDRLRNKELTCGYACLLGVGAGSAVSDSAHMDR